MAFLAHGTDGNGLPKALTGEQGLNMAINVCSRNGVSSAVVRCVCVLSLDAILAIHTPEPQ